MAGCILRFKFYLSTSVRLWWTNLFFKLPPLHNPSVVCHFNKSDMGLIGQIVSIFSKGPAIQNLKNFDMVIQMKDGGLLLPIVCSKHLDDTDDILNLLRTKVENYTEMIDLEEFKRDFPRRDYIQIELNCVKKPDQRILEELEVFGKKYSDRAVKFSWRC